MSLFKTNSKGVAVLITKNFDFIIDSIDADPDGRTVALMLTCDNKQYFIVNVYAPTHDKEIEQVNFLEKLKSRIEDNLGKMIIVGGDFNICLESIDKSSAIENRSKARLHILKLMEEYDLIDIWRVHHPDVKRYTWRRSNPLVQSRLDNWLIGADVSFNIAKCDIKPSIKTDHSLIVLDLYKTIDQTRGKGLWNFNSNLLTDSDYVGYIRGSIELKLKTQSFKDISDNSLKWELMKIEIRKRTIDYSKTQAFLTREYENELNVRFGEIGNLEEGNKTENLTTEFNLIKSKLKQINAVKTEGFRVRAKAQYIEHNEKSSKFS